MASRDDPEEVAEVAWECYREAESVWRKAQDGSPQNLLAMQAMCLAGLTAVVATAVADRR